MARGGRLRRWSVLAMLAGAASHHAFELGAGTGLMLQRELGLAGAAGTWLVAFPALAVAARRDRVAPLLAVAVGANAAACAVHFTLWPWRLTRVGLPVLTSAEGLPDRDLSAYNAILLSWGAASLVASAVLSRTGSARPTVAGFLLALPLRAHARRHFAWVREQAVRQPAWWNRAQAVR